MAKSATRVLPDPTSPCKSRSMRVGAERSVLISPSAASCEAVKAKGKEAAIFSLIWPSPAPGRAGFSTASKQAPIGRRAIRQKQAASAPALPERLPAEWQGDGFLAGLA